MTGDPPIRFPSTSRKGNVPQGVSAQRKEGGTSRRRSPTTLLLHVQCSWPVGLLTWFKLAPLLLGHSHVFVLHPSLRKHEADQFAPSTNRKVVEFVGRHGSQEVAGQLARGYTQPYTTPLLLAHTRHDPAPAVCGPREMGSRAG